MLYILLRILVLVTLLAAPSDQQEDQKALMYLSNFGYITPPTGNHTEHLMTEEAYKEAIKEFQAFAGLSVTGELDNETISTMALPRCGVKDKVGFGISSRSKRYALQGSRWRVKDLTYKISKYPRTLKSRGEVDKEIAKAFNVWSLHTPLTFTQKTSGAVHIEVRFEKGEHGDGDPFDGPGGTLAHAFFPVYGGDAHFDDSEKWTINSYGGTNLFQVAAHEFGHSLGLSHSDIRSALMAPFYRGYDPYFQLDEDDVDAIQALYGASNTDKVGPPKRQDPTTEGPTTVDDPVLCNNSSIDAIFNTPNEETFIFKGAQYWKLTEDSVAFGYPKLISETWKGLPGNIDAAFSYKNKKTYFFKGSQYWRYAGTKMDGDYPKRISEGFAGIPDNVDAAFVWGGNGKLYFFKGTKFWKFDPTQKPPVKSTYPKPISNWEGVPNSLDAALQYTNGYTYFFKQGMYYRFNDKTFSVDQASPPFPRPAGYWWFGCRSETKGGITGEDHDSYKTYSNTKELWISERNRQELRDDDVGDIIMDGVNPQSKRDLNRPDHTMKSRGHSISITWGLFLFSFFLCSIVQRAVN